MSADNHQACTPIGPLTERPTTARRRSIWRRGSGKRRRGAAIVEFALLSPILCMLLIGLFEFGRVLMVEQILTNAAREGAREASLLSTSDTAVRTAALKLTNAAHLKSVTVTISPAVNTLKAGDSVSVTVTAPLNAVSWISGNWFPAGYTLSSVSLMRKEGFE